MQEATDSGLSGDGPSQMGIAANLEEGLIDTTEIKTLWRTYDAI